MNEFIKLFDKCNKLDISKLKKYNLHKDEDFNLYHSIRDYRETIINYLFKNSRTRFIKNFCTMVIYETLTKSELILADSHILDDIREEHLILELYIIYSKTKNIDIKSFKAINHSCLLLLNKKNKTIEFFDSNGTLSKSSLEVQKAAKILSTQLFPSYKFIEMELKCYGIQNLLEHGYCGHYILLYSILKINFPDEDIYAFIYKLNKELQSKKFDDELFQYEALKYAFKNYEIFNIDKSEVNRLNKLSYGELINEEFFFDKGADIIDYYTNINSIVYKFTCYLWYIGTKNKLMYKTTYLDKDDKLFNSDPIIQKKKSYDERLVKSSSPKKEKIFKNYRLMMDDKYKISIIK